jgi:hypothetical protein
MTSTRVYNPRRRRHPLAMAVDGHGTPIRLGPTVTEASWQRKIAKMAELADKLATLTRPLTRRERRSAVRAETTLEHARVIAAARQKRGKG